MNDSAVTSLPIGIFDSGVGGLTVFSALQRKMPFEKLLYLGDTARLPYGTKSQSTVSRYALQATGKLVERAVKALVVACNTATAAALPALQAAYPHIPVIGVVEPGAQAAVNASQSGRILVLGTESTIRNGAYQQAIRRLLPSAHVTGVACSLFVALAEEGWTGAEETACGVSIAEAVVARYLHPYFASVPEHERPDCLVLGCTHFPPLAWAIQAVADADTAIVDSAGTTAEAVYQVLKEKRLLAPASNICGHKNFHFLTTDGPERFARVGSLFLGWSLFPDEVELVSL